MTLPQTKLQDSLECSHCESIGELSYKSFQRQQKNLPVKVWIKNLPEGISESGVRNLFLTCGEPLSISFHPRSRSALVEFKLMKEIELAIRDLHCKAPYNLKVVLANPHSKNVTETEVISKNPSVQPALDKPETVDMTTKLEPIQFKEIPPRKVPVLSTEEISSEAICQANQEVKTIIKILGYDPSVRMRQRRLDFKTDTKCVALGRGYINMGDRDRFVGGLQKIQFESENSKAKDRVKTLCESCQASTTKMCGTCSAPFCSRTCMSTSSDHRKKCSRRSCDQKITDGGLDTDTFEFSSGSPIPEIPLRSGCTVSIPSYFTMQTVFVRPCLCEEKLKQMCNEVAVEAFKGEKLEKTPELYDLVLARYYEDLCFYRGQVCSVEGNKIFVFFIDYGNTQETKLEDLRLMPGYLRSLPGFAVKAQLKDVPKSSSIDAINYYNKLTADGVPLIMKFKASKDEVVLIEKDTRNVVNETVAKLTQPSWKCDESAFFKTGEVFYLNSLKSQRLEVGKTYNLILTHFEEKEFLESEVFWVTDQDTDEYYHISSEMKLRMSQYCEFLQGDCYLPRTNELCLAKENGEWKRCVNLKSHKTVCYLFFLDDGHSSLTDTTNIRKMIPDFLETPSQSVCCTLPDDPKLKSDQKLQSRVVNYLRTTQGLTMSSVRVLKLMGDAYCLGIPAIEKIQNILNILENAKN